MNYNKLLQECLVGGIKTILRTENSLTKEAKETLKLDNVIKKYYHPDTGKEYFDINQIQSQNETCVWTGKKKIIRLKRSKKENPQSRAEQRNEKYKEFKKLLNEERISDELLMNMMEAHLKSAPKIVKIDEYNKISSIPCMVRGDRWHSQRTEKICSELFNAVENQSKLSVHMVLTLNMARYDGTQSRGWDQKSKMQRDFALALNASGFDTWCCVVEATKRGHLHFHYIIQTDLTKDKVYFDKKENCWRMKDRGTFYALKKCWKYGISDIRAVYGNPSEYLNKYICKGFSAGDISKMRKQEKLQDGQRSALLTILCAIAHGVRLFSASARARQARKEQLNAQARENAQRDADIMLLELREKKSLNALIALMNNVLSDCRENLYLVHKMHKLHPFLPDEYKENLDYNVAELQIELAKCKINCSNCPLVHRVREKYIENLIGEKKCE